MSAGTTMNPCSSREGLVPAHLRMSPVSLVAIDDLPMKQAKAKQHR